MFFEAVYSEDILPKSYISNVISNENLEQKIDFLLELDKRFGYSTESVLEYS